MWCKKYTHSGPYHLKAETLSSQPNCYGLNVYVPKNLCVEALSPSVTIFGDRSSKEIIKMK